MFSKVLSFMLLIQLASYLTHARKPDIDCDDLEEIHFLGSTLNLLSSTKLTDFSVNFLVSTRHNRDQVRLEMWELDSIIESGLNPAVKTIFIVHGWKSTGTKTWVKELKEKLLDAVDSNIIVVDWVDGSEIFHYVDAARNTQIVTNKIFNFLQALRPRVNHLHGFTKEEKWNQLYFIGHSLGAQISGQIANLLKKDSFWTVERITGLDPAKPCFTNLNPDLKLDQDDAEFVDIIHTQVGDGDHVALGLGNKIGDVDFYVNGGVMQPECEEVTIIDHLSPITNEMMCSHKLSYKYFTNAVAESVNGGCSFLSYPWDGTFEIAEKILYYRKNGMHCFDCPKIGLDTPSSQRRGMFIVITAEAKPHCLKEDHSNLSRVEKIIQKLKGVVSSLFSK